MKKLLGILSVVLISFAGCEKVTESTSSSFKDYTITVKAYKSGTSNRVANVRVKVGAKDTAYNSGFDQGCPNLGTKAVNSNGEATYVCSQYVGAPSICNVEVYDYSGNLINSSYMYSSNTQVISVMVDN